ncbi:MAG: hypothetical protein JNL18_03165 [Planctomycetaceae bacterium]|nr:hypothetical protein [Planctomycetaceae bacterium]
MLTYLRYALASACFAASVGCLALWWRSYTYWDTLRQPLPGLGRTVVLDSCEGSTWGTFVSTPAHGDRYECYWHADPRIIPAAHTPTEETRQYDMFGVTEYIFYFPPWYPALIFALAGIVSLRLGRRFTLRSALIATTVLAGLLGMAVGL